MANKPDIVYFVKETQINNELTYSVRSVLENFKAGGRVIFYGGMPDNLRPDAHYSVKRDVGIKKWQRVRNVMLECCRNDNISEDFWLFNDDFFVMKKVTKLEPIYNRRIEDLITAVEGRHGGKMTEYTKQMRHLLATLKGAGLDTKNYAVHKPMLINRKKMLEVLEKFPNEPMMRALYGNYFNIGGIEEKDCKIAMNHKIAFQESWQFVSTDDKIFADGEIGKMIREKFSKPCKFEVPVVY